MIFPLRSVTGAAFVILTLGGHRNAATPPAHTQETVRKAAPAFEVVSIRPSKPGGQLAFGSTPDGYSAHNTPLFWLIMDAYYPRAMAFWRSDRLQAAPAWVNSDEYDIEAKVDDATAKEFAHLADDERDRRLKTMLQTMLQERCKLAVRLIEAETTFYALTADRHGPKLQAASTADSTDHTGIPISDGGLMTPFRRQGGGPAFRFSNTSMAALAEALSGLSDLSDLPVEDRTGLAGKYDFVLPRKDEDSTSAGLSGAAASTPQSPSRWDVESLGLALKRSRGNLPALAVEHIERPTPN